MFRNYVRVGDPAGYENGSSIENDGEGNYSYKALSGGSGTDIDFTISFKPASSESEEIKADKTFVFFVDDLDVAASQEWEYPDASDPCYDDLTIDKAVYGVGGEAFILGEGNKLDTITFADQTGLRIVNGNTVVTTGSDPSTSWSEFSVKADPQGANYTWTSGIPCDSYALRNTIPPSNEIKVIKKWEDRGIDNSPRPDNLDFEIKYIKDGVEKIVTIPSGTVWDKDSKENEWSMIFYDQDNTHMPNGGYQAKEFTMANYDIVKGDTPIDIVYNEDSGYFEVTFINKEQMKDISVTKIWVDTETQKHKRPEVVVLVLKDAAGNIVDSYDLSSNEASHVFTVPKYDKDGNEIIYTVDEMEKNSGDLKFYDKSISGVEVTNTYKVIPSKVVIKYIDEGTGEELTKMIILGGSVGEKYTAELKEFDNYKFSFSTDNVSGEFEEDEITVIYYYEKQPEVDVSPVNEDTPLTNDGITSNIITLLLSLIAIVCGIFYIRRKKLYFR